MTTADVRPMSRRSSPELLLPRTRPVPVGLSVTRSVTSVLDNASCWTTVRRGPVVLASPVSGCQAFPSRDRSRSDLLLSPLSISARVRLSRQTVKTNNPTSDCGPTGTRRLEAQR